ncbi:hypothetical protein AGDE_15708 [Angomonas deanei]|uniref:Uncharacterized protein n=1 Tax=Angomonas deanei TaxID=59799 RepID=A0A7G2C8X3_9TRYP|nr:hypothetical protein AGDE_15708 [Angomonas deanei]CAD2216188.1 hypothetical protein, conserved [Angomonas deanei]|eukprot:EPY18598.1 hypothetical protein AGDE_15708 [Angomonas deanei]
MAITKSNIYAVFAILLHLVSTVVHQEAWLTVPLICESMNNFRASYKKYQKRCVAEDPNGTVISLPKLAEEHFNKAEIQLLEYLHYNTELNATEFDRCICSLRGDDVESCSSRLLQTVFEP